jgi:hypothetical protein
MAVGIRHGDHVAPAIRKKLAITSPISGGHSVGIVRSRTPTTEFRFFFSGVCVCVCILRSFLFACVFSYLLDAPFL